ncbi:MAG: DUF1553 domain-containing protein [Bryobacter sp.]|nr:DUF1553 domain-containing protein [Bryobacter sp.]
MKWLILLALPLVADEVQFNRDIRPILSDQCFHCHGPDAGNRKANLRLDVREAALEPALSKRRAIVPGKPEESEVFRRITHTTKGLRMPPAYAGHPPLPAEAIEKIRQWILAGAPYATHWSFLPPRKAAVPAGENAIDYFVRATLRANALEQAPPAGRATLLRRLSFDLTGLPPTPEEIAAFLRDNSPHAYEKQVDRLLASPRYAERMAWRWLEAARYADTNGYQSDGVRDMYRWRDWVIESFARNQPFDRFIVEQLAGDLLPNATREQRMATAFHRNHRTSAEGGIVPEEFRTEYVADRAETTATVFLGLTMGCARCHDHKYDPIPQKDFYRLFAYFNNLPEKGLVYNWGNDEPLMKAPTREQAAQWQVLEGVVARAEAQRRKLEPQVQRELAQWKQSLPRTGGAQWQPKENLAYDGKQRMAFDGKRFEEVKPSPVLLDYLTPFTFSAWVNPQSPEGAILGIAEDYDEGNGHALLLKDGRLRLHVVFRWTDIGMRLETEQAIPLHRWQHVAVTYDGSRYAKGVKMYLDGVEQPLKILFDELNWPMKFKYPLRIGAAYGLRFEGEIEDVKIYQRALDQSEVLSLWDRAPLSPQSHPDKLRLAFLEQHASQRIRSALAEERKARENLAAFESKLPTLMVMREGDKRQAHVLLRGAYDAPGEPVEPGTPSALPAPPPGTRQDRLGLAEWLVDKRNPLTARVTVNRLWQMLFGIGLVKTVEDFGSQGELPVHQELLDWLAVDFQESGWNTKALLKQIVMSETYQQSSQVKPAMLEKDPENRLLARAPRLRLSPEMIRDQALYASGLLVEKQGGPSVKPYQPPGLWQELFGGGGYTQDHGVGLYRRSLYTFWKRTIAPPTMVTFDSPSRESCTVRETRTNTPLQALTLMNEVSFLEASRKLAERVMAQRGDFSARATELWLRVLSRPPKAKELAALEKAYQRNYARYRKNPADAYALLDQGEATLPRKGDKAELAAWTLLSSMALNLDEAVTKQ